METSTIYSMGTALNRASGNDLLVEVLVAGTWLRGRVVAVDGHGVVLEDREQEHSVVRMDAIAAVRVHAPAPNRAPSREPSRAPSRAPIPAQPSHN